MKKFKCWLKIREFDIIENKKIEAFKEKLMIRNLNRIIQDYLRPKRLAFGKFIWDRKIKKENVAQENIIESENIKSILFLRYDGKIGDMIINTLMFKAIKTQYPHIKIGVIGRGATRDIIKNNSYVDVIYNYEKNNKKIKKLAGEIKKEKYDLLIDFSEMLRVQQMMLINLIGAKYNMGLDRKDWNLFDIIYSKPKNMNHISDLYIEILKKLGIKEIEGTYDLQIGETEVENARIFLEKVGSGKKIIFNPYAASKHRSLNIEKIEKIINYILLEDNVKIILLAHGENYKNVEFLEKKYENKVYIPKSKNIMEVGAIIKESDMVISPDTSIVHLGTGLKKPLLGLYRMDNEGDNNSTIWGPNNKKSEIIWAKGTGKKGEETDINNFSMNDFKDAYKKLARE